MFVTISPLGPGPLVYAHRGDRSRAPDNTIEAYRLAVEAGTDGVELDVRRTKDGVLIVSHDDRSPDLDPFASLSFSDVRELAPHVPTLREAMDAIPRRVFVNVEIKNFPYDAGFDEDRTIVDETLDALRAFDDPNRILMSSFDPMSMQRVGEVGPEFLGSLLVLMTVPLDPGIAEARKLGMDAVNPHSSHLGDTATEVMGEINEAQLRAVVWGVNTASEVTMMANAGVAAIITDDPGMAREVIDHL
jgi:glycerophosphoryl diester phosphodiesterase